MDSSTSLVDCDEGCWTLKAFKKRAVADVSVLVVINQRLFRVIVLFHSGLKEAQPC